MDGLFGALLVHVPHDGISSSTRMLLPILKLVSYLGGSLCRGDQITLLYLRQDSNSVAIIITDLLQPHDGISNSTRMLISILNLVSYSGCSLCRGDQITRLCLGQDSNSVALIIIADLLQAPHSFCREFQNQANAIKRGRWPSNFQ